MKLDYSLYMTDKGTTHTYMGFYEEVFAVYDNVPVDFLEIGVAWGGSLKMWKDFFTEGSSISGIENEAGISYGFVGPFRDTQITDLRYIPSDLAGEGKMSLEGEELAKMYDDNIAGCNIYKDDARVVQIDKTFDIIIDDGSHVFDDVVVTINNLWKNLKPGGIYIVEDVSANQDLGWYWGNLHDGSFCGSQGSWKDEMKKRVGLEYEIVDRRGVLNKFGHTNPNDEVLLVFRKPENGPC